MKPFLFRVRNADISEVFTAFNACVSTDYIIIFNDTANKDHVQTTINF